MNSFKYQYFKIKLEEDFFNMLMQAINESGHMQKEGLAIAEENLMVAKVGGGQITKDRQCKVSFIDNPRVFELLDGLVEFANSKMLWNIKLDFIEPLQYTVYGPTDYYDWHIDEGDWIPNRREGNRIRKMSFSIVLPGEFEGGEFSIDAAGDRRTLELKEREAIFFGADTPHTVLPVTSGTRTSLVGWVQGPAWQ